MVSGQPETLGFKKAKVPSITVQLKTPNSNSRFTELISRNQPLVTRILKPGYWPRVRGDCRSGFRRPVHNIYRLPAEPKPQWYSKYEADDVDDCEADDVQDFNSSYGYVLRYLNSARKVGPVPAVGRKVGPVPAVLGEWFPYYLPNTATAGNAQPHPAVKHSGARVSMPATAIETSGREEEKIARVRHDGIKMRVPVEADIDLKAEPVLLDRNQKFRPGMRTFGFKERKEVVEAKEERSVGYGRTRVEEKGVTSAESHAVVGIVEGPVEVHAMRAPYDGIRPGSSTSNRTKAVRIPEAADSSNCSGLGAHAHAKVQTDFEPPRTFTLPKEERSSSWAVDCVECRGQEATRMLSPVVKK
ncbi:hypothetical protein R1sor_005218 [Riccia sorocarpa]|uniref:Uncharacterized protein n=1 Tax=Riccia sorocarpa TaxID=122646 RepID=A0ABD3HLW4_9MARC